MADVSIGPPPHRGILGPGSGSGVRIVTPFLVLHMALPALPPGPAEAVLKRGLLRLRGAADIAGTVDLNLNVVEGHTMGLQRFTNRVEIHRGYGG
jgi:hypothetical protein